MRAAGEQWSHHLLCDVARIDVWVPSGAGSFLQTRGVDNQPGVASPGSVHGIRFNIGRNGALDQGLVLSEPDVYVLILARSA